jgi:hypothetical protein
MSPEWTIDGPEISLLVDLEGGFDKRGALIGTASKNPDGTWTGYDCTRPNDHGTTSFPLGTKPTRDEAKTLVEECFQPAKPADPKQELKADFTSNPWASAVERIWSEICERLEVPGVDPDEVRQRIAQLYVLWKVSQYAGSNTRTGWLMVIHGFRSKFSDQGIL